MARLNAKTITSCMVHASLLNADCCKPEEMEPNPLAIVNTLLALKKPDKLLK